MGRKKKKSTTKSKKSTAKKASNFIDIDFIAVIILIVLAILSFLIIYTKAGTAGKVLSPMLGRNFRKYKIPNSFWNFRCCFCCL